MSYKEWWNTGTSCPER